MIHPLWLILGVGLALLVLGRVFLGRHRRRQQLRDLAARAGLSYSSHDLLGLPERYQSLDLIRRGHCRHVTDVLFGRTEAGPLSLFSYSFEEGFGVRRRLSQWWMVVIELEEDAHKTALASQVLKDFPKSARVELHGRLAAVALPDDTTSVADTALELGQRLGKTLQAG